jgi:hypothetical protein
VQVNDAAEAALAGELEWNAQIRRQPGIAASDDDRVDEHMKLIDWRQPSPASSRWRTTDGVPAASGSATRW